MTRTTDVDMSAVAIAERLEALRALYILGASLATARRLGRVEDLPPGERARPSTETHSNPSPSTPSSR